MLLLLENVFFYFQVAAFLKLPWQFTIYRAIIAYILKGYGILKKRIGLYCFSIITLSTLTKYIINCKKTEVVIKSIIHN